MSNATYEQLRKNETRVLKLKPAKEYNDEIICSLIHITLEDPPEYEALSYVWKNSSYPWAENFEMPKEKLHSSIYNKETKETIFIDLTFEELRDAPIEELRRMYYQLGGHKEDGHIICDGHKVTVGAELNEALRRFRLKDEERTIWVDALCIHQQDLEERNRHVARMGEIYSKADRVLIWLGEYISDAFEAVEVIVALCNKIESFMEDSKYLARGSIRTKFLADPEIKSLRWDMLSDFINRAWFGRTWVLQEVVNAKKAIIHAANSGIDWDALASLITWLRVNDVDPLLYAKGEIDSIDTIITIKRLSDMKRSADKEPLPRLLKVLEDTRACRSTLPIDKVYGVLGLVSEEEASKIEVDYALGAAELFTRVAVSEILKENGLEVLYLCNKSASDSVVKAPSWVPDWTQQCHHGSLASLGYISAVAGSSKPDFRIEGRTLISRGRIFDAIQAVELLRKIPKGAKVAEYSQEALKGDYVETYEKRFHEYFEQASVSAKEWLSNATSIAFPNKSVTKEAHENLWRAFCCNRTDSGKIPPADWSDYFNAFVFFMMQSKENLDSLSKRQGYEMYLRQTRFMNSFGVWCYNRRFYRSENGRFGWVPDQARPGDKLCVLNGLAVPMVLRPNESDSFDLIGDVYIQGMMDGEVLDLNCEEQDIRII
jgi:hypothetical protein